MVQAITLQSGQIRHLLRVTAATSRHPERDCLVLLLGITAGMRVTEIAQLEVQDVLFPSGALRDEISLRAAITKGCRQRCVYFSHAKVIEALDRYLDYRVTRRLRTTGEPGRYRGLEPTSMLILTHKVGPHNPSAQVAPVIGSSGSPDRQLWQHQPRWLPLDLGLLGRGRAPQTGQMMPTSVRGGFLGAFYSAQARVFGNRCPEESQPRVAGSLYL